MALTLVTAQTGPLPGSASTVKFYSLSNPAAGTDWTATVPAGESWHLVAVQSLLLTSATVANRVASLYAKLAGTSAFTLPVPLAITASIQGDCVWGDALGSVSVGTRTSTSLPPLVLPSGSIVAVNTDSLQAGDQWNSITLLVTAY